MNLRGRIQQLERKAAPADLQDKRSPDMRSIARKIAFVLHCGLHEPTGPSREAAIAIARLLSSREKQA
jgi:hypothetical protein